MNLLASDQPRGPHQIAALPQPTASTQIPMLTPEALEALVAEFIVGVALFDPNGLLQSWPLQAPEPEPGCKDLLFHAVWLQSFLSCCFQFKGFTHCRTRTNQPVDLILVRGSKQFIGLMIHPHATSEDVAHLLPWARSLASR